MVQLYALVCSSQILSISYRSKFVFEGPNDLSIADVDAVPDVLGPEGLPKGRCTSGLQPTFAARNLHLSQITTLGETRMHRATY